MEPFCWAPMASDRDVSQLFQSSRGRDRSFSEIWQIRVSRRARKGRRDSLTFASARYAQNEAFRRFCTLLRKIEDARLHTMQGIRRRTNPAWEEHSEQNKGTGR